MDVPYPTVRFSSFGIFDRPLWTRVILSCCSTINWTHLLLFGPAVAFTRSGARLHSRTLFSPRTRWPSPTTPSGSWCARTFRWVLYREVHDVYAPPPLPSDSIFQVWFWNFYWFRLLNSSMASFWKFRLAIVHRQGDTIVRFQFSLKAWVVHPCFRNFFLTLCLGAKQVFQRFFCFFFLSCSNI